MDTILLFGENLDTATALQCLQVLSNSHSYLSHFLRKAKNMIQDELAVVAPNEGMKLGRLDNFGQLGERQCFLKRPDQALENALSITVQVGQLILLTDRNNITPKDGPVYLVGLGKGLLAASVAATTEDADRIVDIGLETLAIGIRLGVALGNRASKVEETVHVLGPPLNTAEIIGSSPSLDLSLRKTLYASSADGPFTATTRRALMEWVVAALSQTSSAIGDTIECLRVKAQHTGTDLRLIKIGTAPEMTVTVQDMLLQHYKQVEILDAIDIWRENDSPSPRDDDVAVVGMSGRFPDCDNINGFWNLIQLGQATHQQVPSSRFSTHDCLSTSDAGFGCFLQDPGLFDHRLFRLSPAEARQMDPVHRLLLITTYEALEMAGYSREPGAGPACISSFIGQTTNDWKTVMDQQPIGPHYLPCINRSFGPGRLGYYFDWNGPFCSIDTGCSSSMTCIYLARDALLAGHCDSAVVGGGSIYATPQYFSGLSRGGFLSKTGACKSFANNADGYCRGEAVAVVVLKRLSDAKKANDNILAVIPAAARNSNGRNVSLTAPSQATQEDLYRMLLREASLLPVDIDYVEMHGTGTQLGDSIELAAVRSVFAQDRRKGNPLLVGAVKANVGHSEAASGVVSLIKSILMLQHDRPVAPKQPGWPFLVNTKFQALDDDVIQIATGQLLPYATGRSKRNIVVNNFDAAGSNGSVLVQSPPRKIRKEHDPRSHHVVIIHGHSSKSHEENRKRLKEYLVSQPQNRLQDIAYTTTARRLHGEYLEAYVVDSVDELIAKLARPIPTSPLSNVSLFFVFTGQGSEYLRMGSTLYASCPSFRGILDSFQEICNSQGQTRFLDFIVGNAENLENVTASQKQVAVVALEVALAQYMMTIGVHPTLVLGHSLGEYTALCIAKVLSVGDTLLLVSERAKLMETSCATSGYAMLSVGLSAGDVQELLNNSPELGCDIACFNGPSTTVISGPSDHIKAFESSVVAEKNVTTQHLRVQFACHSRQMDAILDGLESVASKIHFQSPSIPIASTVLGKIIQPGEDVFNAAYLRRHVREPVRYLQTLQECEDKGLLQNDSLVIEIGPHPICIAMLPVCLQRSKPACIGTLERGQSDWKGVSYAISYASMAKIPINWHEFHKDYTCYVSLIDLPSYAFELTSFWTPYSSTGDTKYESKGQSTNLSFTSLQTVDSIRHNGKRSIANFSSDLTRDDLNQAIQGHVVDGVAICPASVFADIAFTAARYLAESSNATIPATNIEINSMKMIRPLTLQHMDGLDLKLLVTASMEEGSVFVKVLTTRVGGSIMKFEHSTCELSIASKTQGEPSEWAKMRNLVMARVDRLQSEPLGEAYKMDRALFYRLFADIVDYSRAYQVVQEATIASDFRDLTARLQFHKTTDLGTFTHSPFDLDAVVHLAGFLLNANVAKPKGIMYIANYIGHLRVLEEIPVNTELFCYAAIREQDDDGASCCDVFLFKDIGTLVCICTDIRFQRVSRDLFSTLVNRKVDAMSELKQDLTGVTCVAPRPSQSSSERRLDSAVANLPRTFVSPSAIIDEFFDVISTRSGIPQKELESSQKTFTDLGIDSQMTISIMADWKSRAKIELPAAFLVEFPTFADARKELETIIGSPKEELDHPEINPTDSSPFPHSVKATSSRYMTSLDRKSKQLLQIICHTLDVSADDLQPDTRFDSIGIDSMYTVKIMSVFTQDTGIELPAAFFLSHPTVADVTKELDSEHADAVSPSLRDDQPYCPSELGIVKHGLITPPQDVLDDKMSGFGVDKNSIIARAVLMQGNPRSKQPALFLATDGSGTVEAYLRLDPLLNGRRTYGLESPFIDHPDDYRLTIEEMAQVFIAAMRKVQPNGPYLLGGWSAGATYAYEITRQLTEAGETVLALLILDMRVPRKERSKGKITIDLIDNIGRTTTNRNVNQGLTVREKLHLYSTCRALGQYDPHPVRADRRPKVVYVVWATKGLNEHPDPTMHDDSVTEPAPMNFEEGKMSMANGDDSLSMEQWTDGFKCWFFGRRYDCHRSNGWERYLGEQIQIRQVVSDHFSMVGPPDVKQLSNIVSAAVIQATA